MVFNCWPSSSTKNKEGMLERSLESYATNRVVNWSMNLPMIDEISRGQVKILLWGGITPIFSMILCPNCSDISINYLYTILIHC